MGVGDEGWYLTISEEGRGEEGAMHSCTLLFPVQTSSETSSAEGALDKRVHILL